MKITLVDDHKMFLEGLEEVLNKSPEHSVEQTFENLESLKSGLLEKHPEFLILDINLADGSGAEFAIELKQKKINFPILLLSMDCDSEQIFKVIDAGVEGYVLKNTDSNELLFAIDKISHGEKYFVHQVWQKYLGAHQIRQKTSSIRITKREKEVLLLINEGKSNYEIAECLFISKLTVETHRKNLMRKFSANNAVQLLKNAEEEKLL